jgi:hypothetical protein
MNKKQETAGNAYQVLVLQVCALVCLINLMYTQITALGEQVASLRSQLSSVESDYKRLLQESGQTSQQLGIHCHMQGSYVDDTRC